MNKKKLSVRLQGRSVGVLEQDAHGKMQFQYSVKPYEFDYKLSHSLPFSMDERIFSEKECKPFFDGLLPDSEDARKAIARQNGISHHNIFALLQAIGREAPGAVSIHPMDDPVHPPGPEKMDAVWKTKEEMADLIHQLPRYPLLNGTEEGIRISLAGFQDKACICLEYGDSGRIGIPLHGSPSTHILKPDIKEFSGSSYNEYFCLTLAEMVHLNVCKAHFHKVGSVPCLIVERYDRSYTMEGITRLHQEDFCQALGKLSSKKYQNEGGPSFKDCFTLISQYPWAASDKIELVRYILFNFIVGNTDAHGKNYSLINQGGNSPRVLAPLYDVLCTQAYPNHSKEMAMSIGGEYLAKDVYAQHWERFCQDAELSFPGFKRETRALCERIEWSLTRLEEISDQKKNGTYLTPVSPIEDSDAYAPQQEELIHIIRGNMAELRKRLLE